MLLREAPARTGLLAWRMALVLLLVAGCGGNASRTDTARVHHDAGAGRSEPAPRTDDVADGSAGAAPSADAAAPSANTAPGNTADASVGTLPSDTPTVEPVMVNTEPPPAEVTTMDVVDEPVPPSQVAPDGDGVDDEAEGEMSSEPSPPFSPSPPEGLEVPDGCVGEYYADDVGGACQVRLSCPELIALDAHCSGSGTSFGCSCNTDRATQHLRLEAPDLSSACAAALLPCFAGAEPDFGEAECAVTGGSADQVGCNVYEECTQRAPLGNASAAISVSTTELSCDLDRELPPSADPVFGCYCSSADGNGPFFRVTAPGSTTEMCLDGLSLCSPQTELEVDGPLSCDPPSEYFANGYCGMSAECTEPAQLGDLAVSLESFLFVECEALDSDSWSCGCELNGEQLQASEIDPEGAPMAACEQAFERCTESLAGSASGRPDAGAP